MGKFLAGLAAVLMSGLSAGRCISEDMPYKPIFEADVRTSSARLYSDTLRGACLKGRRYTLSGITNGFKRHYEETLLAAVSSGYTIIPIVIQQTALPRLIAPQSQIAFDAERRLTLPRQFGCFHAYWLDDN